MLERLFIQNYAIIDQIAIDFSRGLNVITGETGAGKSIIIGALGLILGERADTSVLLNKEKKSIIEGQFKNSEGKIRELLEGFDVDVSEELFVRREISSNGKSRAFINDTPVTLAQLQSLSALLVDLHKQFDSLEIAEAGFQREVLDALAAQHDKVEHYRKEYFRWKQLKSETEELKSRQIQFEKESDFNRFQFNELEDAALQPDELEQIDAELKMLNHAEEIKNVLSRLYFELTEAENPIVQQLKSQLNQLANYKTYHPDLPSVYDRLWSVQVELNDLAVESSRISDHVLPDTARMNQLNERLSTGYKLQKKHGVSSTNELIEIQEELKEKLQAVLNLGEEISNKEMQLKVLMEQLLNSARQISANRQKPVKAFEKTVNEILARVGMPNAKLKVEISQLEPGPYGIDKIDFLFNANTTGKNKTDAYLPVGKVASGGELSRLMLCIKSLVASSVNLPTMIFDEIDTGISGEAARQVGIIMKELALNRQVLCITHQPQIAGKADAHYYVYKEKAPGQIKTGIKRLSIEERIHSIAKMLGGEKPTAAAVENAKEMVTS